MEESLEKCVEVINKMSSVAWGMNTNLKYISIHVDTRDKMCYLQGRDDKPISIEDIEKAIEEDPHKNFNIKLPRK